MENQPTVTLKQGTGKTSGKPYVMLVIKVGKWEKNHFPSYFERDYLVENWDAIEHTIAINSNDQIVITAGDYEDTVSIPSALERKYVVQYFRLSQEPKPTTSEDDAKIDLTKEDELKSNPFGN